MNSIKLNDSFILSDFGKPYIVAEINTSHFGNIDKAKEMVDKAKSVGCDCVKFQSWSAETLYSKTYYDENPIAKRFVKKFSFSESELMEVAEHCKSIGVSFASTPYSRAEADFLIDKCKVPFIKVASMDLTNYPYLDYLGRRDIPIVLSTGMGEINEIEKAVQTIEATGNTKVCILHCVSIYPPETKTLRLNNILGLRERFPKYPIGYSDHSLGTEMASASIALGACLVEKHFTLDKSVIGMDNQMASEPNEMEQLVKNCHNVQIGLGDNERIVFPAELDQRIKMRRSIVASRDLKIGDVITISDLEVKRPGTGLPPEKLNELVGKKVKVAIENDTLIKWSDIE